MMTRVLVVANIGFSFASDALEICQAQQYTGHALKLVQPQKGGRCRRREGVMISLTLVSHLPFLSADCAEADSAGAVLW